MNKKRDSLGRGIRALLEGIEEDQRYHIPAVEGRPAPDTISDISLESIEVNPFQPRADFDKKNLQELSDSIKTHGVIQPITVRQLSEGHYQLIAGERRLRASSMAGLKTVPAYIRKANDQEMLEMALIENIQRENLNAVEIAINYQRLIEECRLTQEELGTRLGKDRSTVTNYLRLLKLPPEIQYGIKNKKITMGHARALIAIEDVSYQLKVYKEILKRGHSVRRVEEIARDFNSGKKRKKEKSKKSLTPAYQKIQDQLTDYFSTKVDINRKNSDAGEIIISYYSHDDLNRILETLENS